MQLAATRKGGGKRCAICSQIYQRRMQAEFIESGALRRVIAVYRAKHRLQPCEPKPRPAEARKTRPADFGTRIFLVPLLKPRTGCGSRNSTNYKTAEPQKPAIEQPSANNYSLSILLRHYAASGLLNLPTSLAEAVVSATPGRGTAFVENERRKSSVEKTRMPNRGSHRRRV